METVTLEEFQARCWAQGVPWEHVAFKCPQCGTVQSMASLMLMGCPIPEAESALGVKCEGHYSGSGPFGPIRTLAFVPPRGCKMSLTDPAPVLHSHAGLKVVMGNFSYPLFALATPGEAQVLKAALYAQSSSSEAA
mgnify:CR=1 FL=1